MPPVNGASLRAPLDDGRARFDDIRRKGAAGADTIARIDALFLLRDILVAVFREKAPPKTPRNSGIPPSQARDGDGTGQPAHGHRHGIQPGRRVPEVRPRPARAAAPGTRARSPTACRGPCRTVPASGPAPSTGSSPTCSPCAAPPRWCGR